MEQFTFGAFVAITVGLVEVIKRVFPLIEKYAPLFSLIIGILLMLTNGFNVQNVVQGIVVGLSASGLYSGGKSMLKL